MKKLIATLLSVCFLFEFISVPTYALTYEDTINHLEEMEIGLGIEKGSVNVITCDYDTVVASGYEPYGVVGWTDGNNIYLNTFLLTDCDYVWTIAHELAHVKQIRDNRIHVTNKNYYLEDSYSTLDFEVEAEKVAEFFFYYYNFKRGMI